MAGRPDGEEERPLPRSGIPGVYEPGEWAASGYPGAPAQIDDTRSPEPAGGVRGSDHAPQPDEVAPCGGCGRIMAVLRPGQLWHHNNRECERLYNDRQNEDT